VHQLAWYAATFSTSGHRRPSRASKFHWLAANSVGSVHAYSSRPQPMPRLPNFIRDNTEQILSEWETFARSLPMGGSMDIAALRDHAKEMLGVIARDLETPQTRRQEANKAEGRADANDRMAPNAAQKHGAGRAGSGFTVEHMVAEFRALRASVIRLWTSQLHEVGATDLEDITRFNEAIDQAIAEWFCEHSTVNAEDGDHRRRRVTLGHSPRSRGCLWSRMRGSTRNSQQP